MRFAAKILLFCAAPLAIAAAVLWCPYRTAVIPAWTVQVIDKSGQPLAHVQVNQQWINPIDDGMVGAAVAQTDERGFATFPARILKNRLIYRIPVGLAAAKPDANIYVCWQGQFGEANWNQHLANTPNRIVLHAAGCPYG